ncbi:MAG: ABC transporter permease [bacterium]|nr:ABC transporter permease [bacterium]MDP3771119.1 ABC transporter permease [bacterium]
MYLIRWSMRKAITLVVTLFIVTLATFGIMKAAPGNPYATDRKLDPTAERAIRERLCLDRPWHVQYWCYVSSMATGKIPSMRYEDKTSMSVVFPSVRDPRTGQLRLIYRDAHTGRWKILPKGGLLASAFVGVSALLVALLVGVTAGVLAAKRRNSSADHAVMGGAMIGITVPNFVIGPFLGLAFGVWIGWLPVNGWGEVRHLVLPIITLALAYAASFARFARGGMLEVIHEDYVRTARAKGVPEWRITVWHELKLGLQPVVTYLGPATSNIVVGSIVVETIFQIPGIGRHLVDSALNRDYTLLMTMTTLLFTLVFIANAIVDLSYQIIDPRTRGKEATP